MSVCSLQQWLITATVASLGATLGVLPPVLRRLRPGGVLLLILVALLVTLMCCWTRRPWLLSVLLVPLGLGLVSLRTPWKLWVWVWTGCLLQTLGAFFLLWGVTIMRSSSGLVLLEASSVWIMQALSLLVAWPALWDGLAVLSRKSTPARAPMLAEPSPAGWPGCCFQLAIHQEPPELVKTVVEQLMRQEYDGPWMIQVVDNNTADPALWEPVQALCQQWGERVQFLHLNPWPGFKAGALNEGMRHLPEWVSLLAVIDADYLVQPEFLQATARHFTDQRVAFVQTPQHYRNGSPGVRLFYDSAFLLQMASRAENNALWCSGTMLLLRRAYLEAVGGWDEDCLMEDLELSIRLPGQGWRGVYDPRPYGSGLVPFAFASLARQRFRWVFGTMQALKKHWRTLLGWPTPGQPQLSWVQRLSFLGLGCLYLSDGLALLSLLLSLGLFGLSAWDGPLAFPPLALVLPLVLLAGTLLRMLWVLRAVSGASFASTICALCVTWALSWTTARACLAAMVLKHGIFWRTPKTAGHRRWQRALRSTWGECLLTLGLLVAAALLVGCHVSSLAQVSVLLAQAGTYGMAPVLALILERPSHRSGEVPPDISEEHASAA